MPSTTTPIAPVFTHTPACDVNALGHVTRNARDTAATLPPERVDALTLLEFLVAESHTAQIGAGGYGFTCDCADLALRRVTGELERARKALRTRPKDVTLADYRRRDDLVELIDDLVARRDAIRNAQ